MTEQLMDLLKHLEPWVCMFTDDWLLYTMGLFVPPAVVYVIVVAIKDMRDYK